MLDAIAQVVSGLAGFIVGHWVLSAGIAVAVLAITGVGLLRLFRKPPPAPSELEDEIRQIKALSKADHRTTQSLYRHNLAKLEKGGAMVIDLIHDHGDFYFERWRRGETIAKHHLDMDEAFEAASKIRRLHESSPLIFILHTPGGNLRAAHIIADAILDHNERSKLKPGERSIVYVPYQAYSAGTLISLAADKIVMGKRAELGPIDVITQGFQREALTDLLDIKDRNFVQDELIIIKHYADKAWAYAEEHARRIVNPSHKSPSGGPPHEIADKLMEQGRSHAHGYRFDEARAIGLNVTSDCPQDVYDLIDARIRMIVKGQQADDLGLDFLSASDRLSMLNANKFYNRRRLD